MTADLSDVLTDPIVIEASASVSDGAGGSVRVPGETTSVLGQLQPRRPRERPDGGRLVVDYDHVLYLGGAAPIARGDRFHRAADTAMLYRVVDIQNPSYANHHLQVLAKREVD